MKPGTHYNLGMRPQQPWTEVVIVAATGREACARGLHGDNITTVTAKRVVFAAFGQRRPIGERYCTRCGRTVQDTQEQEDPS